jgi:hypothetical protein
MERPTEENLERPRESQEVILNYDRGYFGSTEKSALIGKLEKK